MVSKEAHKKLRAAGAIAVVLAVIAAAIAAVTFALYPYGSKSEAVWSEFRKQPALDVVCIGSSMGAQSFDPMRFDELRHTRSFNLCSPHQSVAESVLGVREALEHHDIKTVFYSVDFEDLWSDYEMYPGRTYLNEKWKGDDFGQRFTDLAYVLPGSGWLNQEKSLNWLFPWTEQRVPASFVVSNMRMKVDGTSVVEASQNAEPGWIYHGQGYGSYDLHCNFNADKQRLHSEEDMATLQEKPLQFLADMCDTCAEHGVQFIAYVPPRPDFGIVDMKDHYRTYTTQVKELVEAHGGHCFDFNLAKNELFESREEYFGDFEHLNPHGAHAFTTSLAALQEKLEAGEGVEGLFMSFDEKMERIDKISIALLEDEVSAEGIELFASCLTGTRVKPEYQFLVKAPGGHAEVVQDYSPDDTCTYKPAEPGAYHVRVNVRQQGTNVDFEKHTQHEVIYG